MFGKESDSCIFDWNSVPDPDPEEVSMWIGITDAKERQFPLQLARQIHDEIEWKLMKGGKMDAIDLAMIRGAMMAISRYAQVYSRIINGKVTP